MIDGIARDCAYVCIHQQTTSTRKSTAFGSLLLHIYTHTSRFMCRGNDGWEMSSKRVQKPGEMGDHHASPAIPQASRAAAILTSVLMDTTVIPRATFCVNVGVSGATPRVTCRLDPRDRESNWNTSLFADTSCFLALRQKIKLDHDKWTVRQEYRGRDRCGGGGTSSGGATAPRSRRVKACVPRAARAKQQLYSSIN